MTPLTVLTPQTNKKCHKTSLGNSQPLQRLIMALMGGGSRYISTRTDRRAFPRTPCPPQGAGLWCPAMLTSLSPRIRSTKPPASLHPDPLPFTYSSSRLDARYSAGSSSTHGLNRHTKGLSHAKERALIPSHRVPVALLDCQFFSQPHSFTKRRSNQAYTSRPSFNHLHRSPSRRAP